MLVIASLITVVDQIIELISIQPAINHQKYDFAVTDATLACVFILYNI